MLNWDLERIHKWSITWKVKFNADKSCEILFTSKDHVINPTLFLNNMIMKSVSEHKHLGITLTTTIDWAKQAHWVCIKANRKLAVLRNVHFLQKKTLDILYKGNSTICSRLYITSVLAKS